MVFSKPLEVCSLTHCGPQGHKAFLSSSSSVCVWTVADTSAVAVLFLTSVLLNWSVNGINRILPRLHMSKLSRLLFGLGGVKPIGPTATLIGPITGLQCAAGRQLVTSVMWAKNILVSGKISSEVHCFFFLSKREYFSSSWSTANNASFLLTFIHGLLTKPEVSQAIDILFTIFHKGNNKLHFEKGVAI